MLKLIKSGQLNINLYIFELIYVIVKQNKEKKTNRFI